MNDTGSGVAGKTNKNIGKPNTSSISIPSTYDRMIYVSNYNKQRGSATKFYRQPNGLEWETIIYHFAGWKALQPFVLVRVDNPVSKLTLNAASLFSFNSGNSTFSNGCYRGQELTFTVNVNKPIAGYRVAISYNPNQLSFIENSFNFIGLGNWSINTPGTPVPDLNGIQAKPGEVIFTFGSGTNDSNQPVLVNGDILTFKMNVSQDLPDLTDMTIGFNDNWTNLNDNSNKYGLDNAYKCSFAATYLKVKGPNQAPIVTINPTPTPNPYGITISGRNISLNTNEDTTSVDISSLLSGSYGPLDGGSAASFSQYVFSEIGPILYLSDFGSLFSDGPRIDSNGKLSFTPKPNANGTTTFKVTLVDSGDTEHYGQNTSLPFYITITINASNDEPILTLGSSSTAKRVRTFTETEPTITVQEDSGLHTYTGWVQSTFGPQSAFDESIQTLTITTATTNTALFASDGQPAVDAQGNLTFTPAADANGTTTVTVTLADDGKYKAKTLVNGVPTEGEKTDSAKSVFKTFTIVVTPENDVPQFTIPPTITVSEGSQAYDIPQAFITGIVPGPSTASDETGQVLTIGVTNVENTSLFAATGQPTVTKGTNGEATLSFTLASNANGKSNVTVVLSDDGKLTAVSGWGNQPQTIGPKSTTKTFTIVVTPVNDDPQFSMPPTITVSEGSPNYDTPQAFITGIVPGPSTASDEADQDLTIGVTIVENASLFTATGQPTVTKGTNGEATLSFTLASNANGKSNVTVVLSDDGKLTAVSGWGNQPQTIGPKSTTKTFTIVVTPVNDDPQFTMPLTITVSEGSLNYDSPQAFITEIVPGPSTASDETDQVLTIGVTNVEYPSLFAATGQPTVTKGTNGEATLSFTLASNANGKSNVTVVLSDDGKLTAVSEWGNQPQTIGPKSTTRTFTIVVTPVNDEPQFTMPQTITVSEGSPNYDTPQAFITGIVPGPSTASDEADQVLTIGVTIVENTSLFTANGQPKVTKGTNGVATLCFTLAADANGSSSVTVVLSDDGKLTAVSGWGNQPQTIDTKSTSKTFTIVVTPVNDVPQFTMPITIPVNEDSHGYESPQAFITGIVPGPSTALDETDQVLTIGVTTVENTSLFTANGQPKVTKGTNGVATLCFTLAADANGSSSVTVVLSDDGTFKEVSGWGNVDKITGITPVSIEKTFTIAVTPVNDAPSFSLPKTKILVLNELGNSFSFENWATGMLTGPQNESTQSYSFTLSVPNPLQSLFTTNGLPTITGSTNSKPGKLTFKAKVGSHGLVPVTVVMVDGGANEGPNSDINHSPDNPPPTFYIVMEKPFLWGDLNNDGYAAAVDASLILRYNVGAITSFPGYNPAEYTEYYGTNYNPLGNPSIPNNSTPVNTPYWSMVAKGDCSFAPFPPAAKVTTTNSNNFQPGTNDASAILQYFAFLKKNFDVDTVKDLIGPDPFFSPIIAKVQKDVATDRNVSVSVASGPGTDVWTITIGVDEASDISGLRIGFQFDPQVVQPLEDTAKLLGYDGLLVTNATEPGKFLMAGALSAPLEAGKKDLVSMQWKKVAGSNATSLNLAWNAAVTQFNDGEIKIVPSSLKSIDLLNPTAIETWMMY